jgi:uncharacterized damage-inducible protein DinB
VPDWSTVLERFDYDLWGNRLWLENLQSKGMPEPDAAIFRHILAASSIWLSRCKGDSPSSMPVVPADVENLTRLVSGWKTLLSAETDDRIVEYRRTTGEPLSSGLFRIVQHVLNHGTYHRGELRGLCRARGDVDFPETDLIAFSPN